MTPVRNAAPVLILDQGDGQPLQFADGLARRTDLARYSGRTTECGLLIADFDRNSGLGRLTVQGEPHFVPLGLCKRLEESGELDDSGQIVIYARRRLEKYRFEVLYRVLPKVELTGLIGWCERSGLLVHDTFSLLYGLFLTLRPQEPTLLVLRTSTGVSLLGGLGDDVLLLRRRAVRMRAGDEPAVGSSAGPDDVLIMETLASAGRELGAACGDRAGRVRGLWLESAAMTQRVPAGLADVPGVTFEPAPLARLDCPESPEGELYSALPWAAAQAGCATVLGPAGVRLRHGLIRAERWLWVGLGAAAAIFLILAAYYGFGSVRAASGIGRLEAQVTELRQRGQALTERAALVRPMSPESLNATLAVARDLLTATSRPTLVEALGDVSASRPPGCRLDVLELGFGPDGAVLTLRGFLGGLPGRVGQDMARLLERLQERGWAIETRRLESGAEGAFFVLTLRHAVESGGKS